MKGAYCLIMKLDRESEISIGRKGTARFPAGFYCYVGSAMNGLDARIARHLSSSKKLHWHIDWFLRHARIVEVKRIENKKRIECELSRDVTAMSKGVVMKGFGSSDCSCMTHLHFLGMSVPDLESVVSKWKG